jgi:hypothetical protein
MTEMTDVEITGCKITKMIDRGSRQYYVILKKGKVSYALYLTVHDSFKVSN